MGCLFAVLWVTGQVCVRNVAQWHCLSFISRNIVSLEKKRLPSQGLACSLCFEGQECPKLTQWRLKVAHRQWAWHRNVFRISITVSRQHPMEHDHPLTARTYFTVYIYVLIITVVNALCYHTQTLYLVLLA